MVQYLESSEEPSWECLSLTFDNDTQLWAAWEWIIKSDLYSEMKQVEEREEGERKEREMHDIGRVNRVKKNKNKN